ncbi:MAG: RluA family pseudouridine synthase [Calditrichaceae bacterium]
MVKFKELKIESHFSGKRLDHFLTEKFIDESRSHLSKLIKGGFVKVNGQTVKSGYILSENDHISIEFHEESTDLSPADIPLEIIFEDNDIIVINKPAGMTVHPGKGTAGDTLVNALIHHSANLALSGKSDRPGIVHRLDKNTSGLLVIAKNDKTHRALRMQFDNKTISRIYWALVWGKFDEKEGSVKTFIDRSKKDPTKMTVTASGREAITHYKVLKEFEYFSLLELKLETGRTHQIRVHMNYLHHPIVGDPDYHGRDSQLKHLPSNLRKRGVHLLKLVSSQFLHAKELNFLHPSTNEPMHFESNLPPNLFDALQKLPQLFLLDY